MALRSLYSGGSAPTIKASDELESMLAASTSKSSGSDSLKLMKEILQMKRYQQQQAYRDYMMRRRMWLDQQKLQQEALGKTDKERKENMARLQLEAAARAAVDDPEYIKRFGSLFGMSSTGRLKGLDALRDEYIKPLADKYKVSANDLNKMLTAQTRAEFQKYREDIQKEAGYFANMGDNLAASWRRLKDLPAELVSSPEERKQMAQEREAAAARDRANNRVLQDQYLRQQEGEGIWDRSEGLTGFLSNTLGAVPEMAPYMASAAMMTNPITAIPGLALAGATGAAQGSQMFTENVMASDVDEATKQQALASDSPERLGNMAIGAGLSLLPVKGGDIARAGVRGVQRLTGKGLLGQELRAAADAEARKAAVEAAKTRALIEQSKRTLGQRMAYGAAEDALTFGTMNAGQQMAMNALTNSALGTNTPWTQGAGEAFAMGAVPGAAFGMVHGMRPVRRPVGPEGTPYLESGYLAKPLAEYQAELAAARDHAAERGSDFAPVELINRMRNEGYSYAQLQKAVEGFGLPEADMARLKDIYERKYQPPVEEAAEAETAPVEKQQRGELTDTQRAYAEAAEKSVKLKDIENLVRSWIDSTPDAVARQGIIRDLLALAESKRGVSRLSENQKATLRWALESRHLADTIADGAGLHKVLDALEDIPSITKNTKDPVYDAKYAAAVQAIRDFVDNGMMQRYERQAVLELLDSTMPRNQRYLKAALKNEIGVVDDRAAVNNSRKALQEALNKYKEALREKPQATPDEQAAGKSAAGEQQNPPEAGQPEGNEAQQGEGAEGAVAQRNPSDSGGTPPKPAAEAGNPLVGDAAVNGSGAANQGGGNGGTPPQNAGAVQTPPANPPQPGGSSAQAGQQPPESPRPGNKKAAGSAGKSPRKRRGTDGDAQPPKKAGGKQSSVANPVVDYRKVTQDALAAEKIPANGKRSVPQVVVDNVKAASKKSPLAASEALAPLFEDKEWVKAMGLATTPNSINTLSQLRAVLAAETINKNAFHDKNVRKAINIVDQQLQSYHKIFGKGSFMKEGWLRTNIDSASLDAINTQAEKGTVNYNIWHEELPKKIDAILDNTTDDASKKLTNVCQG